MIDRRNFLGSLAVAGGWTLLAESASGRADASAVVVADAGQPRLTIVVGSVKDGIDELQEVLRRMSGAEFKIAAEPAKAGSLFVGPSIESLSQQQGMPTRFEFEDVLMQFSA